MVSLVLDDGHFLFSLPLLRLLGDFLIYWDRVLSLSKIEDMAELIPSDFISRSDEIVVALLSVDSFGKYRRLLIEIDKQCDAIKTKLSS